MPRQQDAHQPHKRRRAATRGGRKQPLERVVATHVGDHGLDLDGASKYRRYAVAQLEPLGLRQARLPAPIVRRPQLRDDRRSCRPKLTTHRDDRVCVRRQRTLERRLQFRPQRRKARQYRMGDEAQRGPWDRDRTRLPLARRDDQRVERREQDPSEAERPLRPELRQPWTQPLDERIGRTSGRHGVDQLQNLAQLGVARPAQVSRQASILNVFRHDTL